MGPVVAEVVNVMDGLGANIFEHIQQAGFVVDNQQANNHARQKSGTILCRISYLCWDSLTKT